MGTRIIRGSPKMYARESQGRPTKSRSFLKNGMKMSEKEKSFLFFLHMSGKSSTFAAKIQNYEAQDTFCIGVGAHSP